MRSLRYYLALNVNIIGPPIFLPQVSGKCTHNLDICLPTTHTAYTTSAATDGFQVKTYLSGALNVKLLALVKSNLGHVLSCTGTRSGHDMVYMIGRRISGQPSCTDEHETQECRVKQYYFLWGKEAWEI